MKNIFLLFAIFVILAGFINAQTDNETEPAIIDGIYLARTNDIAEVGDLITTFNTNDIPIYCIIELSKPEPTTVKMNFVAVKVAGVRPETIVVRTSYTTKDGENIITFSGRPDKIWTAGKYRVDVFAVNPGNAGNAGKNEKQSIEFEIKNSK